MTDRKPRRQQDLIDHDLLITISVQLENLTKEFKEFRTQQTEELSRLQTGQASINNGFGTRIRSLEDGRIWLTGWAAGAGAAGAFIITRFHW